MNHQIKTENFADHLTIGEAAAVLGVSPWTLRNWDNSGKLKSARHPVNGHRIYRRDDLDALLSSDSLLSKGSHTFTPNIKWDQLSPREHFVQFYENDSSLVASVSGYVARALSAGEAAIIIATDSHRNRIQRKLQRSEIDLAGARERGQYVALDAADTLSKIMSGNEPDPALFEKIVGSLIQKTVQNWPRVWTFGELVALLWEEENRDGACQLESFWNDLGKRHSFCLYCAYPIVGFQDDESARLLEVCNCHTRVIPAESYSSLSSPSEQLREITLLQQKAQRLEAEITKRHDAERELSDFIENALEGLHKVGPDGIILWANNAELSMLGYKAEEYIGHHVTEFHADRGVIDEILRRLLTGGILLNHPARLRCKDGSIKDVLIHSNGHFANDKFVYSRCFTRDVTELNKASKDRATLAAIVESSQDAIISKTLDGIIRSWNLGAARIFGYTEAEAVGKPITLIIPPDRIQEEKQILSRLSNGERVEHYETIRRAKDGKLIDISLTISPIRNFEGIIIGASKIARDITELKRTECARADAERQLRESDERLHRLLKLLPVAVYTCQASGELTYWNDQATMLWGRTPKRFERYCGSHKLFLLDGANLPHDQCPMALAVAEGREFRNEQVEIERPDGSRIMALVNIDLIRDAEGEVVGAINVFQDISALKEAEKELKESDRRKDEFLATLAHELRNPLAPIRNSLNILRMAGPDGEAPARLHQIMDRQVTHLVRLVDDLLELSRISRGTIELKKERIAVSEVIGHALEISKPLIDAAGLSLKISMPETSMLVEADAIRLSQVFSNILNNAAKYTNKGGEIILSTHVDRDGVVVTVSDNGIGLPRDMLSRVFDMFVQVPNTLRRKDGMGIGLSLVKKLVVMHGGTVEAQSDGVGMGSQFIVRLPRASADSSSVRNNLSESSDKGKITPLSRVLVVDDNRDSAESLGMLLQFLGRDVQTAYDGPSAIEQVKVWRPAVILMDLGMPGMDGCEAARLIRQMPENKNVMLIALTGWGQQDDRRRTHEAGFDHHLVKPVDLDKLQALLLTSPA